MTEVPPSAPFSPRELRVSDAERQHVVGVLQKAIGHGMLTLDECTARMDAALAARTRAELNAVVVDLPGLVNGAAQRARPVELRTTLSSVRRSGSWVVPAELLVRNRMGSADLDFTEARVDHAEVRVELDVTGGSVALLLPDGATVDAHGVQVTAGSVEDKTGAAARGGGPHFVVTGAVKAGSLSIRRPRYLRLGRLVARWPWKISWS